MARFNLQDYETVEERLHRFWGKHPNGRVHTELVCQSDDLSQVVFKASIWRDTEAHSPACSTGYAEEHKSNGRGPNADCWIENAETSAIGRGLANLGMSGNRRATREEMAKVQEHEAPEQASKEASWYVVGQLAKKKAGFRRMSDFFARPVRSIHDVSSVDLESYINHLNQCEDKDE